MKLSNIETINENMTLYSDSVKYACNTFVTHMLC